MGGLEITTKGELWDRVTCRSRASTPRARSRAACTATTASAAAPYSTAWPTGAWRAATAPPGCSATTGSTASSRRTTWTRTCRVGNTRCFDKRSRDASGFQSSIAIVLVQKKRPAWRLTVEFESSNYHVWGALRACAARHTVFFEGAWSHWNNTFCDQVSDELALRSRAARPAVSGRQALRPAPLGGRR